MSGNRINAHKRIDLVQKLLVVFTVVTFLFSATLWVSSKYRGYEFRVFPFSFPLPYEFFRWFNDFKKNPPVNAGDAGDAGDPVWIPRKTPWWRKWQPTPVLLLGEFHGQTSLAGYSLNSPRVLHGWACEHVCCIQARLCSVAKLRCEAILFVFSEKQPLHEKIFALILQLDILDTRTVSQRLETLESTRKSMFIYRIITKLILDNVSGNLWLVIFFIRKMFS